VNLPEAPASINFKFRLRGYDAQLTLRDVSGSALLPKFQAALSALEEMGAEPRNLPPLPLNPDAAQPPQAAATDPSFCSIHNCKMTKRERNGDVWYSHKAPDDTWCRGK